MLRRRHIGRDKGLPPIVVFCIIETYAVNNTFIDVWVMLTFGVFGFFLEQSKVPLGSFVIGFVLAPIAENNLRTGLMITAGVITPIFTRPMRLFFVIISIILLIWPFYKKRKDSRPS